MTKPLALGCLLLLSTALTAPAYAQGGQTTGGAAPSASPAPPVSTPPAGAPSGSEAVAAPSTPDAAPEPQEEEVDISVPGGSRNAPEPGEIVVTGRNIPNPIRATPEVVAVLSTADIARTGEGDIAGALQRVTGLSVVGNGFVYVRGLGDRYSLALLNGSPLPSPEPLRRVVPLDIFPTSVIASSLVQKSYSVNYPGEFGGGVINLTTVAIPTESFLSIGGSISGDTETTGKLGYTYFGSRTDWTGFDNGTRDTPAGIAAAINSGTTVDRTNFTLRQRQDLAASLVNAKTTLLQRNFDIPANGGLDLSAGTSIDIPDGRIGVIAAFGYNNTWRTRDIVQQSSTDPDLLGQPQTDFRTVLTDNRILVNGLIGLGAEFGEHKVRLTNLYIRDTLKQGRLSAGENRNVQDANPGAPPSILEQSSYWFERQLIDTQFVGEFKFGDLSVDLRGTYAQTQRESPYERDIGYVYLGDGNSATKNTGDVDDYVNALSGGGQFARVAFSALKENVYSGGIDVSYPLLDILSVTTGYNYTKTERTSSRYQYNYDAGTALPLAVSQERPDYLLSDYNIYTYGIGLIDVSGSSGAAAYDAGLRVHAGYIQGELEITPEIKLQAGVRYEDGVQSVRPLGVMPVPPLKNDYFLPAGTLTWNFADNMQVRVHGSKTIARPQFRELAPQVYQDFESDRQFTGNPYLQDSTLINAEARYEWYFRRGERITLAGFYKDIKNPIETVAFLAGGGGLSTGFSNAPKAKLYGGEFELQTYIPLDGLGGDFFASRRIVVIGNYTYSKSEITADDTLAVRPNIGVPFDPLNPPTVASNLLFRDGAPLTGQSDHLVNAQLGLESSDKLSQATVLLSYASKRVTNRGPLFGTRADGTAARQPDIIENPGFRVDFVLREGLEFLGREFELKMEARNLTRRKYQEYQKVGGQRIDLNTYKVGASVSLGLSVRL